jgi:hypothetical protein
MGFKYTQEITRLDGHMLAHIAHENHPHHIFLSQAQQFFALPVRLQPRLVANDDGAAQIKLGRTILEKIGHRGCLFEPFRLQCLGRRSRGRNGNHTMPSLIQAALHFPLHSRFPSTRHAPRSATLIRGV